MFPNYYKVPVEEAEQREAVDYKTTLIDDNKEYYKKFGWHENAKQLADWIGISYLDVYERPVIEMLATRYLMEQIAEKNKRNQSLNGKGY